MALALGGPHWACSGSVCRGRLSLNVLGGAELAGARRAGAGLACNLQRWLLCCSGRQYIFGSAALCLVAINLLVDDRFINYHRLVVSILLGLGLVAAGLTTMGMS